MNIVVAVFVFLAFANYVAADKCEDDKKDCLEALFQAFQESAGSLIDCEGIRESMKCFSIVCEKCLTGEEKKSTMEDISRMIVDVRNICPLKSKRHLEISAKRSNSRLCNRDDLIKQRLTPYIEVCGKELAEQHTAGSMILTIFGVSACHEYVAITRCVTKRYGVECGEAFEKPFFNAMMLKLKREGSRLARSPECAEGIRKATEFFHGLLPA